MLPITKAQALRAARWMKENFGAEISAAFAGTPFSVDHLCGMICQETAYFWLQFVGRLTVDEILARCVLDAGGDIAGHPRRAFPRNTAAFKDEYGEEFTEMLIAEANETRRIRGLSPAQIVYKGYGIFQYDLQFVRADKSYFREKKWYRFAECLARAKKELMDCYARHGELRESFRCYNGSGARAVQYAANVMEFSQYCAEVDV